MNLKWYEKAIFYAIYPLSFCGVLNSDNIHKNNNFDKIIDLIPYLKELGINSIYLGPIFQSTYHGYDTEDYFNIDSRLGNNQNFKDLVNSFHNNNIKVVIDAVFNHIGREHSFFKDVLQNRQYSKYYNWFYINDDSNNAYNDGFDYEGWAGYKELVKLKTDNDEVIEYLVNVIDFWKKEFNIDGIRLDACDSLKIRLLNRLREKADSFNDDFWIMGEAVHGDYRKYLEDGKIHSVTNYECYKGIFSSHNDKNYFEIAYSLNRLFNLQNGIYRNSGLYNFVDNHDVNRIFSVLDDKDDLFNVYTLLFTIPGIPSIYYGSEKGLEGKRDDYSDIALRPNYFEVFDKERFNKPEVFDHIKSLCEVKKHNQALNNGSYDQLFVKSKQFGFIRKNNTSNIIVILNSDIVEENVNLNNIPNGEYTSLLDKKVYYCENNMLNIKIKKKGACILIAK